MEFDEDLAIQFIRDHVDPAVLKDMDDDIILDIIDIIWDYYEDHGMLNITLDDDDSDEIDLDQLTRHAVKLLRKSNPSLGRSKESADELSNNVRLIIQAELQYEDTLDA
ncbi:MAG: hypothetical protein J6C44_03855 [Muribaculaceae bacterium]|nr:hypothetical protein [Muribaculaceae bacterium]